MKGRLESEIKVEEGLKILFEEYPELKDYSEYMSENSYLTRNEYIRGAYKYLKYIKNETDVSYSKLEDVGKVTLKDLMRFINRNRMKYYEVNKFYHYLVVSGHIDRNLCELMDAPKDRNEHKITSLTLEEIQTVKNNIFNGVGSDYQKSRNANIKRRDYAIVMLALTSGLRVGSIREINLEDLNFENGELTITEKGNKTRTIFLTEEMVDVIKDYLPDRTEILNKKKDDKAKTNALFISKSRNRISPDAIGNMLKKYTYNIEKHITAHKLRSTCATILYDNTHDLKVVQETLNHASVTTTMRYIGAKEERLRTSSSIMGDLLLR